MSESTGLGTVSATTSSVANGAAQPYPPSWLDSTVAWVEKLPWPFWASLAALWIAATLVWHVVAWSGGQAAIGTFDLAGAYWGFLAPALLWSSWYLERVAAAAFDAFRPALTLAPDDAARLRYALIVVPARPALVITILAVALTAADIVISGSPSYPVLSLPTLPVLLLVLLVQSFYAAVLFQLVYRLIRQMGLVRRTLATSVAIDIFRPGPLHAFASLTARPGIVLIMLTATSILFVPVASDLSGLVAWVPYVVVVPLLATITFIVPLTGVHRALVDQRDRLQDAAQGRLKTALEDMAREVDAGDLSRADAWNKTLLNLQAEGTIVAKLPTWPWSMGTLRGFVSAILVPLALLLLQEVVGRVF